MSTISPIAGYRSTRGRIGHFATNRAHFLTFPKIPFVSSYFLTPVTDFPRCWGNNSLNAPTSSMSEMVNSWTVTTSFGSSGFAMMKNPSISGLRIDRL